MIEQSANVEHRGAETLLRSTWSGESARSRIALGAGFLDRRRSACSRRGHAEQRPRQERDQGVVRGAIDRRGGQADQHGVVPHAVDTRFRGRGESRGRSEDGAGTSNRDRTAGCSSPAACVRPRTCSAARAPGAAASACRGRWSRTLSSGAFCPARG